MKRILITILILFIIFFPIVKGESPLNVNKKTVALSFDDGPSEYTTEIVSLLNDYNANATFFVLGNKLMNYKESLNNIILNGNEIANHTYSHPWLTHLSVNETIEEIEKTNNLILKLTGVTPTLFRPSYGDINKKVKESINMKIVMWTNDSSDWKYRSSKTIASNVIRNIKDEDIILMHDTYKRSYEALKIILDKLADMGYQVVTVSELLEIKQLRELYNY